MKLVNKTISDEVKELIQRNKGYVQDTLNTLNQMILIYSILATKDLRYRLLTLDLQNLKTNLQVELENYKNEKNNLRIWCTSMLFSLYSSIWFSSSSKVKL